MGNRSTVDVGERRRNRKICRIEEKRDMDGRLRLLEFLEGRFEVSRPYAHEAVYRMSKEKTLIRTLMFQ